MDTLCVFCNEPIANDAIFCHLCGKATGVASSEIICIACGKALPYDAVFCPYCKHHVEPFDNIILNSCISCHHVTGDNSKYCLYCVKDQVGNHDSALSHHYSSFKYPVYKYDVNINIPSKDIGRGSREEVVIDSCTGSSPSRPSCSLDPPSNDLKRYCFIIPALLFVVGTVYVNWCFFHW